jgi:uncharacterized protein with GYD domain
MNHYLIECSYTPQTLAALIKQPQNRIDTAVKPLIEKSGGRVTGGWFSGNTDRHLVFIAELPSAVAAATISYAIESTGALRDLRITPLLSPDEFVESLRKASTLGYRPPGA